MIGLEGRYCIGCACTYMLGQWGISTWAFWVGCYFESVSEIGM